MRLDTVVKANRDVFINKYSLIFAQMRLVE